MIVIKKILIPCWYLKVKVAVSFYKITYYENPNLFRDLVVLILSDALKNINQSHRREFDF
jgi:hypothetical protein